jgi:hypothetical protein
MMVITPAGHNKEMHHHVYLDCPATKDLRDARDAEVDRIIRELTPTPQIPLSDVPKWYSSCQAARGQSEATRALALYNRRMAALAFCPMALPAALKDVGVPQDKIEQCITDSLTAIAMAGHTIWHRLRSCFVLASSHNEIDPDLAMATQVQVESRLGMEESAKGRMLLCYNHMSNPTSHPPPSLFSFFVFVA